jgi:hypothetical protein
MHSACKVSCCNVGTFGGRPSLVPTAQVLQIPAAQRLLERMENIIRAAPPTTAYNKTALLDSYQEALQVAAVSYPDLLTAAQSLVMSPDEASEGGDASVPVPAATQVKSPALLTICGNRVRWHKNCGFCSV